MPQHRYKIREGFSIVSDGVEGQPIHEIKTNIAAEPSDTALPTEKAVKEYVDENAIGKGVLNVEGGILVAGPSAVPEELAPGEEGQILSMASGSPSWVDSSQVFDKDVFADSDEVAVEGSGTQANPYTLDLTGKVHSDTGIDIKSDNGSDIVMFSTMDAGATASRNMDIRVGYELDAYAPSIMRVGTDGHLYVTSPNEFHYNITKFAVAQSTAANAKKIEFDGSISEYINSRRTTADGLISETAAGPLSISSSGATASFQGAGPTTVESTGGAPVTVKSNGDSSNYSSLVVAPNAGTLSVNASTANHTLSAYSKSVVDGTTNITELNLNDSTGASLHSSSSPIRVTSDNAPIYLSSPAGAPIQISSNVVGGQYGYSLVQTQSTSVNLKSYGDATTNGELAMSVNTMKLTQKGNANSYVELQSRNDSASPATYSDLKLTPTSATVSIPTTTTPTSLALSGDASIAGMAKNITLLASVAQGDTGTSSINIGAVQGNTIISGTTISLIGAPNGGLMIDSYGTRIIDPSHQVSVSSDSFAVNVKYDTDEQHYSSSIDMGTNASLSSYNTVGLYNNESGSSLELPNNGKIVGEAYGDIDLEAHDGCHAILRGTESYGGEDYEAKLDINYSSTTLSSNAGPINITNTGSTINLTSVGQTSSTAPRVDITANGGTMNLVNSAGSTINLSSSVSSGGTESSSAIQLSSATFGYTSTYHSGTGDNERTHNTQVSATPGEIRMSIQNPVGGPSATHKTSSVLLTANNTMEISNTDHIILSGVTDVKQDTEWSLKGFYYNDTYGSNLTLGGICTLSCATGPINITDSCGAPINLKVEGDSTHYTTITENVTGLSASVTGASSPLSFSMSGSNGQSSISMSAKSVSLMAAPLPTDTGTASFSIGGPMIGSLLFGTSGVSLLNPTLPTYITTTELKLPGYNNAYDSSATHKLMTYAYSDAGVELAEFSDITNDQFGLDSSTEAGSMFWVNMTGDSADTPEVEILAPGSVGQVLTIGASGVPEWANGGGGGIVQSIADTDSVDLSLDANGELTADVRISPATGNTAQIVSTSGEEGLYVPASELDGIITTEGDLIVGGASGVPEALSVGSQGQVLSVGSSGLEWTTPSVGTNWYLGAFTTAQRPANPTEGQYGYDTTIDCVIWYIGGNWKNAAGAIV